MSLPKGNLKSFKPMDQFDIMKTPFVMFQAHHDDYYNMSQESLRGLQVETILSKVFFFTRKCRFDSKTINYRSI